MAVSHRRSPFLLRSFVAAPAVAAALTLTGMVTDSSARADGIDSQFLGALQAHNINFGTPQAAILAAHQVCDELDNGRQKAEVANEVTSSSNLDGYHAGYFVGVSIAAYCPRHHATN
ncbi:hypothetical protein A9X01_18360 [Mycobacterium asiaticum]|uniref:DUF732 domain-containing protein n=2 Tax=Mycobacterium asiaticum TaxID=1790 RepID=A0A1A3CFM1_MYCAS|nr:hypothetical protein A9X01_18360 [Mycobacterium asiaticum]